MLLPLRGTPNPERLVCTVDTPIEKLANFHLDHLIIEKVTSSVVSIVTIDDLNYAFRYLCGRGHVEAVSILLKNPLINPAFSDNSAIRLACQIGRTDCVKILLEDPRVNPSARQNEAIVFASERGFTDIVEMLLNDDRVDATDRNCKAIKLARKNGHLDICDLINKKLNNSI